MKTPKLHNYNMLPHFHILHLSTDFFSLFDPIVLLAIEVKKIGGLSPPFLVLSERPVGLYTDENPFSWCLPSSVLSLL